MFMAAFGVVGMWAEERVKDTDRWLWCLYNAGVHLPWVHNMIGVKRFSAAHRPLPPDTDSDMD